MATSNYHKPAPLPESHDAHLSPDTMSPAVRRDHQAIAVRAPLILLQSELAFATSRSLNVAQHLAESSSSIDVAGARGANFAVRDALLRALALVDAHEAILKA